MFWQRGSHVVRTQWHVSKSMARLATARAAGVYPSRRFHDTAHLRVVKPVLLADIGEGIVECEIIQWFVEPGARVEEFSPLCEVQSDKASVEITSRFSGVVKKLHYDAGDMAKVGKPFVDIDIQGGAKQEDLDALTAPTGPADTSAPSASETPAAAQKDQSQKAREDTQAEAAPAPAVPAPAAEAPKQKGKHAALATPAVRHLSKTLNVDIAEIDGTGRDGRVLKEDIQNFVKRRESGSPAAAPPSGAEPTGPAPSAGPQVETRVPLTVTQQQMFKSMTRSLNIPHFLYADEVDFSSLVQLRTRLNRVLTSAPELGADGVAKLSYLPFIIKAVSLALYQYPILNARVDLDASTPASKPSLVMRSQHNIGVAMDTPSGLLVPVIRNVGALNILSIAKELTRLQKAAFAGKLTPQDLGGGTITVSNIGNIGGTYLSPVIVDKEVAILGIGRMRAVPAFESEDSDRVVRKHVTNFSWSADHRVVDGATMARAAEVVRRVVEEPDVMVMHLR
ncbi:Lipoamide acyltransferase component of branched-chain alpha-keto acid dehydrogenase complex [Colletotrichum siamense]|uniref:Dihydrolipoamide acetyltransferase component of pyruvate dehydrogenase complex n=1 Tax=Colletotrichum siamense TaxID=690259 RepID=A0A9P5K2D9_COLSI|nr:Lipoamide acyltransferase component of branched-chain alpha-keto acid dehydrogenase complex [Colletotrichum siamense]KAF4855641.1 Lipoamide acyltransferase component of branched-chain alpha-keto acid dehydrogenase complex [Colletotrichum siamense]